MDNGHPIQLPESVMMLSTTLSNKILLWDNSEFHARQRSLYTQYVPLIKG